MKSGYGPRALIYVRASSVFCIFFRIANRELLTVNMSTDEAISGSILGSINKLR
jgi:hypothetical protein